MSGRTRLILTIAAVIVACLALYWFFVKPQRAELARVNDEIAQEEIKTTQLEAELQRLQGLQANAPALQAELSEIRRFVPKKPDLSNFIFQVQEAANRAGLDFVQISPELPAGPPEGAALAQVQSSIVASGGYFSLQDFLRRLYGLDRALRADTVTIAVQSLEPYGTRLTMTLSTRIFFEVPGETPAALAPAPGATPTPTPTPTP